MERPLNHEPHWVYRCFDAEGRLLYIGCTSDPSGRQLGHRGKTAWWDLVDRIDMDGPIDGEDARKRAQGIEAAAIRAEDPMYNRSVEGKRRDHAPLPFRQPRRATVKNLPPHPTVVAVSDIANRLRVPRGTVDAWIRRGIFPKWRWKVGGRNAYDWNEVEQWAKETGRL